MWVAWLAWPSAWGPTAEGCIVPFQPVLRFAMGVGFMTGKELYWPRDFIWPMSKLDRRHPQLTSPHLGISDLYFFLCPSAMAGGTSSRWKYKAFLFPPQIATCVASSSSSLSLYWGTSLNSGLFIFHIMCTLIGTLHPRDFLRKH